MPHFYDINSNLICKIYACCKLIKLKKEEVVFPALRVLFNINPIIVCFIKAQYELIVPIHSISLLHLWKTSPKSVWWLWLHSPSRCSIVGVIVKDSFTQSVFPIFHYLHQWKGHSQRWLEPKLALTFIAQKERKICCLKSCCPFWPAFKCHFAVPIISMSIAFSKENTYYSLTDTVSM